MPPRLKTAVAERTRDRHMPRHRLLAKNGAENPKQEPALLDRQRKRKAQGIRILHDHPARWARPAEQLREQPCQHARRREQKENADRERGVRNRQQQGQAQLQARPATPRVNQHCDSAREQHRQSRRQQGRNERRQQCQRPFRISEQISPRRQRKAWRQRPDKAGQDREKDEADAGKR